MATFKVVLQTGIDVVIEAKDFAAASIAADKRWKRDVQVAIIEVKNNRFRLTFLRRFL